MLYDQTVTAGVVQTACATGEPVRIEAMYYNENIKTVTLTF